MPDGSRPADILREWDCWIADCLDLMDGDGAFAHWHYPGSHSEQPDIDLQIYNVIRNKWNELRNDEMKKSVPKTPSMPAIPKGR
jgi:hypothetical protein